MFNCKRNINYIVVTCGFRRPLYPPPPLSPVHDVSVLLYTLRGSRETTTGMRGWRMPVWRALYNFSGSAAKRL